MRALDDLAGKCLGGLRSPEPEAIDGDHDATVGVHALQRIGDWQRRDGTVALASFLNHPCDRLARNERARRVVNDDDLTFARQILETVGY